MKNNEKVKNGISVIIPTFNRAKFLYPTLICLCNQKNLPCEYEIIVVDSGDDESDKIVDFVSKSLKKQIVYRKIKKCKNRSLIRNRGAELAHYEILCFFDNDILVPPDFIKRHFEEHLKNKNLVLMQCRRLLIQFNLDLLGEECLINNFQLLEKLPWYKDERLDIYEDKDQWRFVFSHTLSLKKSDFVNAGTFNKKFGEHWGFEDLELGYNLMAIGCNFKLISDSFVYHQPHFTQSNKEQNETRFNKDLFVSLHNYYEVELYSTFYTDYGLYTEKIDELTKKCNLKIDFFEGLKFNKILAYLNSQKSPRKISSKYQLGTYIPLVKEVKRILIRSDFFYLPEPVQISIITEAFRVSKKVFFYKENKNQENTINKIAKKAGFELKSEQTHRFLKFSVLKKIKSSFYVLVLPEIYSPEKRFVYSWLIRELIKSGKKLLIRDLHSLNTFSNDDLRIENNDSEFSNFTFKNFLGTVNFQSINSLSLITTQMNLGIANEINNVVFNDLEYCINSETLKKRGLKNCSYYSEKEFAEITLVATVECCKKFKSKIFVKEKESFILFMENGFYEDGIDISLEALVKLKNKKNNIKITIKMPNYENLLKNCLPLHNDASRNSKFFSILQKYKKDEFILKNTIRELNLEKNVTIVSLNLTILETIQLISKHNTLIYMSRCCYVAPEVYIAVYLNKNVYLGNHNIFPNEIKNCVTVIKSEKTEFSDELKVPISCMNVVYSVFKCDVAQLEKALENPTKKEVCTEKFADIQKRVNKAFVES